MPKKKSLDPKTEKLEAQIKELEEKVFELENSKLRALADYQNLQKRVEKEREELSYTLVASVLNSVIDIKDDLERHLQSEESEAVKAIVDKLNAVLSERGVVAIEVKKGDAFDHSFMEAVTAVPVEKKDDDGKVFEVIQNGFKLTSGRIIRATKVVVGKLNK